MSGDPGAQGKRPRGEPLRKVPLDVKVALRIAGEPSERIDIYWELLRKGISNDLLLKRLSNFRRLLWVKVFSILSLRSVALLAFFAVGYEWAEWPHASALLSTTLFIIPLYATLLIFNAFYHWKWPWWRDDDRTFGTRLKDLFISNPQFHIFAITALVLLLSMEWAGVPATPDVVGRLGLVPLIFVLYRGLVILHEIGHAVIYWRYGVPVEAIYADFGGNGRMKASSQGPHLNFRREMESYSHPLILDSFWSLGLLAASSLCAHVGWPSSSLVFFATAGLRLLHSSLVSFIRLSDFRELFRESIVALMNSGPIRFRWKTDWPVPARELEVILEITHVETGHRETIRMEPRGDGSFSVILYLPPGRYHARHICRRADGEGYPPLKVTPLDEFSLEDLPPEIGRRLLGSDNRWGDDPSPPDITGHRQQRWRCLSSAA